MPKTQTRRDITYCRNPGTVAVLLFTATLVAAIGVLPALSGHISLCQFIPLAASIGLVVGTVISVTLREKPEPLRDVVAVPSVLDQLEEISDAEGRRLAGDRRPLLTGTDGEPL